METKFGLENEETNSAFYAVRNVKIHFALGAVITVCMYV